jgi:hypothetical protein
MTSIILLAVTKRGGAMHVLFADDRGQLILKRLWLWHQILARSQAARLDRALAEGASPEASASLAARAAQLTSTGFRRDLAASLRRILVAAEPHEPSALPMAALALLGPARPSRLTLRTARISRSAPLLAEVASRLTGPGPVPVRGVAMVAELLADGAGPLYHEAARDDLGVMLERAAAALSW